MEREKTARYKSQKFALKIIKLYRYLCRDQKEFVLSKQLLRSGTSIGANLAEAEYGVSLKDFQAKVYIALKECSETIYWLELLYESDYITSEQFDDVYNDCKELLKMTSSTTKTIRTKLQPPNPDSNPPTPNSRLQLPTPNSQLPTPNSQLPTPNSQLLTPNS